MKYVWSPSMSAFNSLADDNIEVTKDQFDSLFAGQASGLRIVAGADGQPVLVEPDAESQLDISQAVLASLSINAERNIAVIKPAVDGGYAKPEHVQLLADWQRYRYELMSVPEQPGWPESPQWPGQPETII